MRLIEQALNTRGESKQGVSGEGQSQNDRDSSLHAKIDGEETSLDRGEGLSGDSLEHDGAIDK